MILTDLNIICLKQAQENPFQIEELVFESTNRNKAIDPIYSSDSFDTAHKLKGWWYTYWPNEELFFSTPFFDLNLQSGPNMLQLTPQWDTILNQMLSFFIKESPDHTIGVLIRVQDRSSNVVHKSVDINSFMRKIRNGEIRFNELYFVTK